MKLKLKRIAQLKFGSVKAFGQQLGIKKSHSSHILSGTQPLKQDEHIHRTAGLLGIDEDILKRFYADCEKQNEIKDTFKELEKIIMKLKKLLSKMQENDS